MLQLILMFLGLAYPNSQNSEQNAKDHHHITVVQSSNPEGDTGGETHVPPKK